MPKFHPHVLRDYALIADGERGALVSPRGDIVWLCAPRWDCDAVFSALIGGEGVYAVTPAHTFVWGGYYEEGTLIWRSRWITVSGLTECREALAFPGEPRPRRACSAGSSPGTARPRSRSSWTRGPDSASTGCASIKRHDQGGHGAWTGRAGDLHVRWSGEVAGARVRRAGGASVLAMNLTVPAGQSRDLVLELSAEPLRDVPPERRPALARHRGPVGRTPCRRWTTSSPRATPGRRTWCCAA